MAQKGNSEKQVSALDNQLLEYCTEETNLRESNNPLLVILGPTGSGKTSASIYLAHTLNGEIISADSAQIHRGMDIGTAKITAEETEGIPHHMIDIVDPDERFSVAAFKQKADEIIKDIYARGKLPMIVGGTMLWIDALLNNYQFPEETDPINDLMDPTDSEETLAYMQAELQKLDPQTYESIDTENSRRVARALAFVRKTGKSFIAEQQQQSSHYSSVIIGLKWPREVLYERLNQRVTIQLDQGLLDEVRIIRDKYGDTCPGMQCISYRQMAWYLNGDMTLEEATEKLKQANRNYAKRQMTWWRRNKGIKWFDCI